MVEVVERSFIFRHKVGDQHSSGVQISNIVKVKPNESIAPHSMADAETNANGLGSLGLLPRLGVIASALVVVGLVAIPAAIHFQMLSMLMAFGAWLVCVISSLAAHVFGEYPKGDENFMARLAGSMGVRTGPPFLAVILVKALPSLTFKPGFVLLIVLFYLVGLLVDVFLTVRRLKSSN